MRVEPNAALAGTARVVVLDPVPAEYPERPVVHSHGKADVVFAHRVAKHVPRGGVQPEKFRNLVKLCLCHRKGVERFAGHACISCMGLADCRWSVLRLAGATER